MKGSAGFGAPGYGFKFGLEEGCHGGGVTVEERQ